MRKSTKTMLGLFLAVVFSFTLAACGSAEVKVEKEGDSYIESVR